MPELADAVKADPLAEALSRAAAGEYEILRELGRGGMATVYLAHELALDRKVAIKVVVPTLQPSPAVAERFLLEARTAAALAHPHIIPIYTIRRHGDLLYFVMQYLDGKPLDQVIAARGALPVSAICSILRQVGSALAFAHRKGVIHRDVKPGNILLDGEGKAVVTDFGIAKLTQNIGITQVGATVGTPSHMSPEQCRGGAVTGASDQYSLGMVAYEMIAGRTAFVSETTLGLIYAHVHEAPPPLGELRPDCPADLAAIVTRMLEKAPEHRWPSLDDVVAALPGGGEPAREGREALVPPVPAASRATATGEVPVTPAAPRLEAPRASVGRVTIAPAECAIGVGDAVQLSVSVRDERGGTLHGRSVAWQSSAPAVAVVNAAGIVTGVGPGEASITVVSEGRMAAAQVVVRMESDVNDGAVEVCPSGGTLSVGQTLRLSLVSKDTGVPLPAGEVQWEVTEADVVRVTSQGDVTGEAPGTVTIAGTARGLRLAARFSVTRVEVTRVQLNLTGSTLYVGEELTASATAFDRLGSRLAGRLLRWESSDAAVAVVDQAGFIRALGPGVSEITASCGAAVGKLTLRVRPPEVAGVHLSPRTLVLAPGEIGRLAATAVTAQGKLLPGLEAAWTSSDPSVVAVAADGTASGLRPGSVRVAATIAGRRSTVRVEVRAPSSS